MPPRDTSFPEGNDVVLHKGPCTSCSSSDGMATYADGHTHCFVCGTGTPPGSSDAGAGPSGPHHARASGPRPEASGLLKPSHDLPQSDEARGLKKTTYAKFGWHRPEWQDMLGPILPAQVVYHVAGTGIGESTDLAELVYDLTMRQGAKVACLRFEDTRRDLKLRLMTMHASQRLDIEPLDDAAMLKLHEEVFGHGRLELFDPTTAEWTMDAILGYVRYCAKALDCQVVVVDPLSFVAAGIDARADERRTLDTVSKDFAQASKELGINMQVSHHLSRPEGTPHEEGAPTSLNQVRGSGGIANFASIVIRHERNTQAEGDGSLITQHRALKNRPRSRTSMMGCAKYDLKTGRLPSTTEQFPGPTSKGRGAQRGGDFPPAGSQDY